MLRPILTAVVLLSLTAVAAPRPRILYDDVTNHYFPLTDSTDQQAGAGEGGHDHSGDNRSGLADGTNAAVARGVGEAAGNNDGTYNPNEATSTTTSATSGGSGGGGKGGKK